MKKQILLSTLLASSLLASESFIDSIGINLGVSHISYNQENHNGSITLGNNPDQNFKAIEVYTTLNPLSDICKEYNMKPYVSYTYSSNDELVHQYILVGINKYYNHNSYDLYAGILAGYGELKYKYSPIPGSKTNDFISSQPIVGMQTGLNYPITSNIQIGLNLKALYHDYDTYLNPNNTATANLEHRYTTSAMVSIGWRF
jgi:hypothetical protein